MNEQSDLLFFIQLVFGIWAVFCFFAVPIWISQIAKNTKRIAENTHSPRR
jgi:cyanate permease